jgi:hypothetical protein
MRTKYKKKLIRADGSIWFYCPDCQDYRQKIEFPKWEQREVGGYCLFHHNKRQVKRNKQYYQDHKKEIRKQQTDYREKTGRTLGGSLTPVKRHNNYMPEDV